MSQSLCKLTLVFPVAAEDQVLDFLLDFTATIARVHQPARRRTRNQL